jgi:hypothetical protein
MQNTDGGVRQHTMLQNRAQSCGWALYCSLIILSIVAEDLHADKNEGAYALLSGFSGSSTMAWAKNARWRYKRTEGIYS